MEIETQNCVIKRTLLAQSGRKRHIRQPMSRKMGGYKTEEYEDRQSFNQKSRRGVPLRGKNNRYCWDDVTIRKEERIH